MNVTIISCVNCNCRLITHMFFVSFQVNIVLSTMGPLHTRLFRVMLRITMFLVSYVRMCVCTEIVYVFFFFLRFSLFVCIYVVRHSNKVYQGNGILTHKRNDRYKPHFREYISINVTASCLSLNYINRKFLPVTCNS